MTPAHHPPEALIDAHAAGETDEGTSLLLACHLTLCPPCRRRSEEVEAVAGALLADLPEGAPLAPDALAGLLGRLDEAAPPPPPVPPSTFDGLLLPRPLMRHLGAGASWKSLLPGISGIRLPVAPPGTQVRLVRLRPWIRIPAHDHGGTELTVVFSGGFAEEGRVFHRGDFSLRQPGERHAQRVLPGPPCVALTLNAGPLVPLTWLGRVLALAARD